MNKIFFFQKKFITDLSMILKSNLNKKNITKPYFHSKRESLLPNSKKNIKEKFKNAAVLCAIHLSNDNKVDVILTVRSKELKNHAGQVSFPGGIFDKKDLNSPKDCALREADEEIGINKNNLRVLGQLNDYVTRTKFKITPMVAILKKKKKLKINKNEVAEVFYFPIEYLSKKENLKLAKYSDPKTKLKYSYYDFTWNSYRIWGTTAKILVDLSNLIKKVC